MPNLYTQLAGVYDEIYQTLFDYDAEFAIYADFLTKHKAKRCPIFLCERDLILPQARGTTKGPRWSPRGHSKWKR